jgi:hypothetical protein
MEQKDLDDLRALLTSACQLLTQVMLRVELLRAILVKKGIVTTPEFEELLKELESGMNRTLEERAREQNLERQDLETERLLKFLKEFEGTKQ